MNWLRNPTFDVVFILSPPFLVLILFLLFPEFRSEHRELGTWGWVALVLCVDVSHVYSSLWRTYFHQENFKRHRNLYLTIPLAVWVLGTVIYGFSGELFWSIVAYVAVFHFMRQQYGFMRLYSRGESQTSTEEQIDFLVIHALCFYPVLHWHAHLPRNFHWMIPGDFISGLPVFIERTVFFLYLLCILVYVGKEGRRLVERKTFNLPKNLIILSTGLTWYIGIVAFNGDLTFTLTNVIAHGVPYMALVWATERRESNRLAAWWGPLGFLLLVLIFAYGEEALWAGLVWREHLSVFGFMRGVPQVTDPAFLAIIVPLLTLPQATHYVLDGFIWKNKTSLPKG